MPARTITSSTITAYINLTFLPGLPAGVYTFVAHTTELQYPGITDAAGNPLDDTDVPGEGTKDFIINFDVQPQPVYITSMALESTYSGDGSTVIGTEQSYFELPPSGGTNTRDNVPAPPTAVVIDFSNPLPIPPPRNGSQVPINYASDWSSSSRRPTPPAGHPTAISATWAKGAWEAPAPGSPCSPTTPSPSTATTSTTQTWTLVTTPAASGTRLVLQLDPGSTLAADDYRVYIPNQVDHGRLDHRRHPDLRHLRQPARRRKPRQPDVAVQPRFQQSRRPGGRPRLRRPAEQRHHTARTT